MIHDPECEMALGIHQGAGPTCQCATRAYMRNSLPGEEHPYGLRDYGYIARPAAPRAPAVATERKP